MNKLHIETLAIETTRRCNLECAHCLRGETEQMDMQQYYMASVLAQCSSIGTVVFTGGEPFLNNEVIDQFIELVDEYSVEVSTFYIATNGVDITPEALVSCSKLYTICDEKDLCLVELSNDMYHQEMDIYDGGILKAFKFFRKKYVEDSRQIRSRMHYTNIRCFAQGRYARDYSDGIEVVKEPFIVESYGDITSIMDNTVYLNCEGNLIGGSDWSYESQREPDKIIGASQEPIAEGIDRWNESLLLES